MDQAVTFSTRDLRFKPHPSPSSYIKILLYKLNRKEQKVRNLNPMPRIDVFRCNVLLLCNLNHFNKAANRLWQNNGLYLENIPNCKIIFCYLEHGCCCCCFETKNSKLKESLPYNLVIELFDRRRWSLNCQTYFVVILH